MSSFHTIEDDLQFHFTWPLLWLLIKLDVVKVGLGHDPDGNMVVELEDE